VISWAILTGEYPPALGGVADYTRQVARALATAGDEVDVWTPRAVGGLVADPGVTVHELPDHFGPRSLMLLERELGRRRNARVFLQYVPQSLGMRGMNLPLCLWFAALRQPAWVLFHEVAFLAVRGAPWKHHLLSVAHRLMAAVTSRGADREFVSTPTWNAMLHGLPAHGGEWLPLPSTMPTAVAPEVVARVRESLVLRDKDVVIGHFGTYGPSIASLLTPSLRALLAEDPHRVALLLGRGSTEFAAREIEGRVGAARVIATGPLDPDGVAAHVAASEVVLQPYPDGASGRRTSLMSCLALGAPVITNSGPATEPLWHEWGAVALAGEPSVDAILRAARPLLQRAELREELGRRGRALYQRAFSLDRVIRILRDKAPVRGNAP
jgi:glycosyltransferase involved in cell wall biosynthesis